MGRRFFTYEAFFLFAAHRFFINIDNRLRPAAVRWWRFLRACAPLLESSWIALLAPPVFAPSSAAIALSSRFLSALSSDTIL